MGDLSVRTVGRCCCTARIMAVAFEGFHHDHPRQGWVYAHDQSRLYFGPMGLMLPAEPFVWTTCPYCGGDLPHCDNR